ncbi:ROK family transcriptional regulator [Actinoplanes sp. TRM 88003]|uniref:ROK family transcriptional regulator n=1 Tax=Paractinoplanes aksuensis TaxID=2939490 RepID=A0ABT1DG08_9ACTN|nr:ROK family transcriptional regulator [Actinoplanes aksuensis]MCO8269729.1 ROK family transcriptional regulator [Actinoplanes aksuensis]
MDPAKPSQELLRALTDEHVLRALMRHRLLTRAELSTETGISKPTAGESVRRLTEAGLLVDTGRRTQGGRGRGRVGSYYSLAPDVGTALAVSIAPEGVTAECLNPYGDLLARAEEPIGRPARPDNVTAALKRAVDRVHDLVAAQQNADTNRRLDDSRPDAGTRTGSSLSEVRSGDARPAAGTRTGSSLSEVRSGDARPAAGTRAKSNLGHARIDGDARTDGRGRLGYAPMGAGVHVDSELGDADVDTGGQADDRARVDQTHLDARAQGSARAQLDGRPRLAVVSAADPVDRHTGRLLQLPDAPFLLGEIDPVAVLAGRVDGPVYVDNDVNWAAEAERAAAPVDDFAYVYLDEGLGCAVVSDGEVRRGHRGVAGEIAHLITVGPEGRAMPLIEVFGELGLRRPGSTAIDVERVIADRPGEVVTAVGGLIAALATLIDPEVVVIGGRWGTELIGDIIDEVAYSPRPVPVRAATVDSEPSLAGARNDALHRLRELIVSR